MLGEVILGFLVGCITVLYYLLTAQPENSSETTTNENRPPSAARDACTAIVERILEDICKSEELRASLEGKLQRGLAPLASSNSTIRSINLTSLRYPQFRPRFTNVSQIRTDHADELRVEFDVWTEGFITATVKTTVQGGTLLPQLPVDLVLTVRSIRGHVQMIIPPGRDPTIYMSFSSPPRLDMRVEAGKVRVERLPLVGKAMLERVHQLINKHLVTPTGGIAFHVPIPKIRRHRFRLLSSPPPPLPPRASAPAVEQPPTLPVTASEPTLQLIAETLAENNSSAFNRSSPPPLLLPSEPSITIQQPSTSTNIATSTPPVPLPQPLSSFPELNKPTLPVVEAASSSSPPRPSISSSMLLGPRTSSMSLSTPHPLSASVPIPVPHAEAASSSSLSPPPSSSSVPPLPSSPPPPLPTRPRIDSEAPPPAQAPPLPARSLKPTMAATPPPTDEAKGDTDDEKQMIQQGSASLIAAEARLAPETQVNIGRFVVDDYGTNESLPSVPRRRPAPPPPLPPRPSQQSASLNVDD